MKRIILFALFYLIGFIIAPYENSWFNTNFNYYWINTIEITIFLIGYLIGKNV